MGRRRNGSWMRSEYSAAFHTAVGNFLRTKRIGAMHSAVWRCTDPQDTRMIEKEEKNDAESIYLSILRVAAHGITPKGCGVSPVRQSRYGADKTGIREIRCHERRRARRLCKKLAVST